MVQVLHPHLKIRPMTTLGALLRNTGGQSLTLRHGLLNMDMNPPLIRSSDHIKRYNCDNVDTIVNSSSSLRFERRVNDN